MNTCFCHFDLRWVTAIVALLILSGKAPLAFGQNFPSSENPRSQLFREIETNLKVETGSTVIELTITNRSQDTRYLIVPLDLTPYRIKLTAKDGETVAMTPKGKHELTEPAAGSMRVIWLEMGVPWTYKIDLGPLFAFPEGEDVICEVSRHVRFNHPDVKPGDIEWIAFPPATIRTRSPVSPPATKSAPEFQRSEPKAISSYTESGPQREMRSGLPADAPTKSVNHDPLSSTPWSVIVVLIVAALGLLWLLLKRRS